MKSGQFYRDPHLFNSPPKDELLATSVINSSTELLPFPRINSLGANKNFNCFHGPFRKVTLKVVTSGFLFLSLHLQDM